MYEILCVHATYSNYIQNENGLHNKLRQCFDIILTQIYITLAQRKGYAVHQC